jgi:hypothetical protein
VSYPYLRVEIPEGSGAKLLVREQRFVVVDQDGVEIDISSIVGQASLPLRWNEVRRVSLDILAVRVVTT